MNTILFAQENVRVVGLKGGAGLATLELNNEKLQTAELGFLFGAYFIQPIDKERFSIQFDLGFTRKGAFYESQYFKNTLLLGYLELAVMPRYSIFIKEKFYLYFIAGPYLGIPTGATLLFNSKEREVSINDSPIELGFQLGLGLAFPIGPGRIVTEFKNSFGLTNLNPKDLTRNRIISFSIGYDFPISFFNGQAAKNKKKDEVEKKLGIDKNKKNGN